MNPHGGPRSLFPRPSQPSLKVDRERVTLTCPGCGRDDRTERYPVLRVSGWQLITRCGACLTTLASEPAPTTYGFNYLPHGTHLQAQSKRPRE